MFYLWGFNNVISSPVFVIGFRHDCIMNKEYENDLTTLCYSLLHDIEWNATPCNNINIENKKGKKEKSLCNTTVGRGPLFTMLSWVNSALLSST